MPVSIHLCRNVQLLWSHIIDFYVQLMDAKYLDNNSQQYT